MDVIMKKVINQLVNIKWLHNEHTIRNIKIPLQQKSKILRKWKN